MKELDKDALLEEAIRRFPLGTKYRVKEYTTGKHYLEGVVSKTPYWGNNGREDVISGYNGILWSSKHGWSEPIEEPKVEIKFEKDKWYKYDNWYIKFNTLDSSGIWLSSEQIDCDRNYNKREGRFGGKEYYHKKILLTNLQEIQQYLPADHPDKIKQEVKEEVKPNITWRIGDYVVFIEDWSCSKKGDIDKIEKLGDGVIALYLEKEGLADSPLHKECKLKVFPTLQEAQKFSDELLGKNKTSLSVEDLVEGEIYCSLMSDKPQWESLYLYHGNGENMFKYRLYIHSSYKGNDKFDKSDWGKCTSNQYRLATPLEKKWLKTCIKQDKFIPKEDLDKYDDEGNLIKVKACVKCNTEQEFDFAAVKLNCTQKRWFLSGGHNCINLDAKNHSQSEKYYKSAGYIIYSFDEWLELHNHKEAYEAQFKKDEEFKVGDWIVIEDSCKLENGCIGCPEGIFKIIKDTKEHIHGLVRSNNTYLIQTSNAVWRISNQGVRKALPHEIPVENTVTQKPLIFEDCSKLDFEVKWKEPRYIGGVDPISAFSCGIFEQMKKQSPQSRKTPDLIDKTKVKVEIKRTKVKQIKL